MEHRGVHIFQMPSLLVCMLRYFYVKLKLTWIYCYEANVTVHSKKQVLKLTRQ
jgi:hypothetical protein